MHPRVARGQPLLGDQRISDADQANPALLRRAAGAGGPLIDSPRPRVRAHGEDWAASRMNLAPPAANVFHAEVEEKCLCEASRVRAAHTGSTASNVAGPRGCGKSVMGTVTDQNLVTMICPNLGCGRTVSAPTSARGKSVRCPHCNAAFRVPGGALAPPAPDSQPKPKARS